MKALEDLKEILEDELKKIAKKGEMNPQELEATYKAIDILKDIATIKAMEESGEQDKGEYSQRQGGYSRDDGNANAQGGSYHYAMMPMEYGMYRDGGSNRGGSNNAYARGGRGGSYDGGSNDGGSYEYSREGSYEGSNDGSYEGGSYARGRGRNAKRDSRGRYSREGYSRAEEKEEMMNKLEQMLDKASTQKEREAIMECMEKLEG